MGSVSLHEPWQWVAVFFTGALTSFINSIAGGGSMFSIPLLIFLGIPPLMANGTNRVGILWGNFSSASGLRKGGYWDSSLFIKILVPVILGSILGSFLLVQISDRLYQIILAAVIILSGIFSFLSARPEFRNTQSQSNTKWSIPVFFLVGLYGGSLQIGMGFIMIFAFTKFTGLDLLRVNAIKGATAFLFLAASLFIFIQEGKIDWPVAMILSAGCFFGGWAGSKWQIKKGEKWVRRVLLALSFLIALKLLFDILK